MLWLLPTLLLTAEPAFTLEEAAQIELDQQKAAAAVARKFGGRKSSELTSDERRELIRAQAEAEREVLEKHGTDVKTWARFSATRGRADTDARRALVKDLAEKERKAEEARASQPGEQREIQIQRGISDEQPAVLEELPGSAPVVEQGLPAEARADEETAKEFDAAAGTADRPAKKPETKRGKRR